MRALAIAIFILLFSPKIGFGQGKCDCGESKSDLKNLRSLYVDNQFDSIQAVISKLENSNSQACKQLADIWSIRLSLSLKEYDKVKDRLGSISKADISGCESINMLYQYINADYYYRVNQYDSASTYALRSIELSEKAGDMEIQARSLNTLALVLDRLYQPEKSIVYRKKAVTIARESGDLKLLAVLLNNLAVDYGRFYELKEAPIYFDSTKATLKEALGVARKAGDIGVLLQSYKIMAGVFLVEGNYPMALKYADSTIQDAKPGIHDLNLASAYYKKADAYIFMGEYKKARAAADSSIKYAKSSGLLSMEKAALDRVYETAELLKDYKTALEAYKMIAAITDSLRGAQNTAIVNELEQKYNKAENEKTISELNQQKQIDSLRIRFLIAGVAISVLVIIIVVFFYRQSLLKNKQQMLEAEQRLNRARMDPHFFFNALSSVQAAMLEGKNPQETALFLSRFAKIMRQSLESTYNELISIEEEVEFLENYMNIQKARHPDKFDYEIKLDDNIDPMEEQVPSMIIQPFVENAIEHAFKGIDYKGSIVIAFQRENNGISIIIEDNGVGTDIRSSEPKKHKHVSRALQIIEDRLFILNKKTKKKASFEVINKKEESGTKVKINLPLL